MDHINSNPEFVAVTDKLHAIETELAQIGRKRDTILAEIRAKAAKTADPWEAYLAGEEIPTHPRASFQEELRSFDEREQFLVAARDIGAKQLDAVRGGLSLAVCDSRRGEFVEQVRIILRSLEMICDANSKMRELRDEIEDAGFRHGSIPFCQFDVGGDFSARAEAYGSRPVFYRRECFKDFPELTTVAGKLRAVGK